MRLFSETVCSYHTLPLNDGVPQRCRCYLPKRALTRLPMLPNSRIGELLPHHWISSDYSLPSWEGQVQTEHPDKDECDKPQAQER